MPPPEVPPVPAAPAVPAPPDASSVRGLPSLPDVLRDRAATRPDDTAYVFVDGHGEPADALTYAGLHARALAVAAGLRHVCGPGDRALLMFPPGLAFLGAWFGCLYAGVVAVPVNPPRRGRVQDATRSIVADCAPTAVLTVAALRDEARPALAVEGAPWLAVDDLAAVPDAAPEPVACPPEALAFLQYTSGSTSSPKGVEVTHGNLVANQAMIRDAFGHDEHSGFVGWAPLFHDQGLIGNVLQPLWLGTTSVLMSPSAFIRRPLLWLETISRYRAHTSGGPNFAFDACVAAARAGRPDPPGSSSAALRLGPTGSSSAALRLGPTGSSSAALRLPEMDLSCWKVAFNGAEPLRAETLDRFAKTFAPVGFDPGALYPCYGLAEATLLVSGSRPGRGARLLTADVDALGQRRLVRAGDGRVLVGSGRVLPGEQVRIVDPDTALPSGPDRLGEIWVAGPHVAHGYWRRPDATAATFGARIAGEGDRTYLRTGDLGVLDDGELYVAGRLKDMIVIRGRNLYPQDLERTVQAVHPALRPGGGAAFSVPGAEGEQLVLVQEVAPDLRTDPDDLAGSVRAAVTAEHEVAVRDVVLTPIGRVQRTSSGKIMRAAARARYLGAGFEPWTPTPEPAVPATP